MEGSILSFSLLPAPSPLLLPFCTCHQELGLGYGFFVPRLPRGQNGEGGGVLWISIPWMIEWGQKPKLKKIPRASNETQKNPRGYTGTITFLQIVLNTLLNSSYPKKTPKLKISTPKKSFDHPCHLKSRASHVSVV